MLLFLATQQAMSVWPSLHESGCCSTWGGGFLCEKGDEREEDQGLHWREHSGQELVKGAAENREDQGQECWVGQRQHRLGKDGGRPVREGSMSVTWQKHS